MGSYSRSAAFTVHMHLGLFVLYCTFTNIVKKASLGKDAGQKEQIKALPFSSNYSAILKQAEH